MVCFILDKRGVGLLSRLEKLVWIGADSPQEVLFEWGYDTPSPKL